MFKFLSDDFDSDKSNEYHLIDGADIAEQRKRGSNHVVQLLKISSMHIQMMSYVGYGTWYENDFFSKCPSDHVKQL